MLGRCWRIVRIGFLFTISKSRQGKEYSERYSASLKWGIYIMFILPFVRYKSQVDLPLTFTYISYRRGVATQGLGAAIIGG